MRVILIVLFAVVNSSYASIVVDSVNIQGSASVSGVYYLSTPQGQIYLSEDKAFLINVPSTIFQSISSDGKPDDLVIPPDSWLGDSGTAEALAAATLDVSNGIELDASASWFTRNTGSASAGVNVVIRFHVFNNPAMLSYGVNNESGFQLVDLASGNLLLSDTFPVGYTFQVDDFVVQPGTYEFSAGIYPTTIPGGPFTLRGDISANLSIVPEVSSFSLVVLVMGALALGLRARRIIVRSL